MSGKILGRRVIVKAPRKIEIEAFEVKHPSRSQVLIKTSRTLISIGTELTKFSGEFPKGSHWEEYSPYPYQPGYSNCGRVIEVGEDVRGIRVGDRVVSLSPHAEYVVADAENVFKVPGEVSDEEATFAVLAATAMNGVRLADISLGEKIVVVGLGIVGMLACQFSRLSGGFPVIGIDLSDKRLRIARELGVDIILNPRKEDVVERISSITGGAGADVVFDATGNPKVIPWAIRLVKRLGRFVVLGSPRGATTLDFHDEVNWPSRTIIGAHFTSQPAYETPYNPWTVRRNIELFFDLLLAGKVDVGKMITEIRDWREIGDIYRRLMDPLGERLNVLGVILKF